MPLKFENSWRFRTPGTLPLPAVHDFETLLHRVVAQGPKFSMLEHFKRFFAGASGTAATRSSSVDWAISDLQTAMRGAADNAALFIAAFYDACEAAQAARPDIMVPPEDVLNHLLREHAAGYTLRGDTLLAGEGQPMVTAVPPAPSLAESAQQLIRVSLAQADTFLDQDKPRQAVQEVMWLLETVSTAFQGVASDNGATIQGKYFNTIVADLRRNGKGKTIERVAEWITALHGYLSSPTGGGVRHGTHIVYGDQPDAAEGRLFCNLARSYIGYLLAEHARLTKRGQDVRI